MLKEACRVRRASESLLTIFFAALPASLAVERRGLQIQLYITDRTAAAGQYFTLSDKCQRFTAVAHLALTQSDPAGTTVTFATLILDRKLMGLKGSEQIRVGILSTFELPPRTAERNDLWFIRHGYSWKSLKSSAPTSESIWPTK